MRKPKLSSKNPLPWWLFGAAVIGSSLLWAFSFPGFLFPDGVPGLGFVALVPLFFIFPSLKFIPAAGLGALWGALSTGLSQYWLGAFHPLGLVIGILFYGFWGGLSSGLMSWSVRFFPRWGFFLQAGLWISLEYLRTLGFLGYPYGALGASVVSLGPWVQSADLWGIHGVGFLTLLPGAFLGNWLYDRWRRGGLYRGWSGVVPLVALLIIVCGNLVYGFTVNPVWESWPRWKAALIQHHMDPFKGGDAAYARGLERLKSLSEEALKSNPQVVIWSETAFVPSIRYHDRYREPGYENRLALVRDLLDFMEKQRVPYLIGNGDGEKILKNGILRRFDFNGALVFEGRNVSQVYRKVRLVPFTESFPEEGIFTPLRKFLESLDTHFWEPGEGPKILQLAGVQAGPLICFEDVFADQSRYYGNQGAQVLVNLTNDSWSEDPAAMKHHLALARFRSLENRRSLVRASNGGLTALVEPSGAVTQELKPFIPGTLTVEAPLAPKAGFQTPYALAGESLNLLGLGLSSGFLVLGALVFWGKRRGKVDNQGNVMENGESGD